MTGFYAYSGETRKRSGQRLETCISTKREKCSVKLKSTPQNEWLTVVKISTEDGIFNIFIHFVYKIY